MSTIKDDWHKPRSKGQHLNADEIAVIRRAYLMNRFYRDVARELECSSRVVSKYYSLFQAEGLKRGRDLEPKKKAGEGRFYKSTFTLDDESAA